MSQVIDYAWYRPDLQAVKAKYIGVLRYLAPLPNGKVVTTAEYQNILAHGLQIALNWESYANRAKEGAAAGLSDAREALRQANLLGYAGCIYFSIDYDAPESDQAALNEYFKACAQVLGLGRLGAYAGYWPLKRLFDASLITYGWQTVAWSGGNRESRAHLFQTGKTDFNGQADINDVLKDDWRGNAMPPVSGKAQQAKDVWGTTYPDNTGIHACWLDAYINHSIVCGPPIGPEFATVDWSTPGNPIRCQYFGSGVRIEFYTQAAPGIAAGTNRGYLYNNKQLW